MMLHWSAKVPGDAHAAGGDEQRRVGVVLRADIDIEPQLLTQVERHRDGYDRPRWRRVGMGRRPQRPDNAKPKPLGPMGIGTVLAVSEIVEMPSPSERAFTRLVPSSTGAPKLTTQAGLEDADAVAVARRRVPGFDFAGADLSDLGVVDIVWTAQLCRTRSRDRQKQDEDRKRECTGAGTNRTLPATSRKNGLHRAPLA